ncbi:rim15, signal transduction response regulator [Coemansia spiralis]|uniref:non-specific serine/threonine protein kinase n=2 Tax=Coemansia TaxID=4863 RepID=A0A9W8GC75_9FUNG|nr:rim15, signal transduction response regulator [Coemansia umbellata]KAJ2621982.1 rim15, signal transduction response regulator [Coemansia sp. RSA 1358]KAJ2680435.1 rim15, signal transduction response regulator [Coemansia spiralis]
MLKKPHSFVSGSSDELVKAQTRQEVAARDDQLDSTRSTPKPIGIPKDTNGQSYRQKRGSAVYLQDRDINSHSSSKRLTIMASFEPKSTGSTFNLSASPLPRMSFRESGGLQDKTEYENSEKIEGEEAKSTATMIRTCPIPEKLRLHLRDQTSYSTDSSSPTTVISSANTLSDSPRIMPDSRVRRRGTVSGGVAGGSWTKDSQNTLYSSPDQHNARRRPSASGVFPRHDKQTVPGTVSSLASGPMARRTSSNNSSWSVATPTSATEMASDSASIAGTAYGGYNILLPGWGEPANPSAQLQPLALSSRSRSKGRRYSVFDMPFVNQMRSSGGSGNNNSAYMPQSPLQDSTASNRKGSSKSTIEAGTLSSADAPYTSAENIYAATSPFGQGVRKRVSSSFFEPKALYSSSPQSPVYLPAFNDLSPVLPRNHQQRSSGSVTTFSSQKSGLSQELQHTGERQTLTGEQDSDADNDSRLHVHQRKIFSTDYQDSSSGQSTPNRAMFALPHHKRSGSIRSANVTAINQAIASPDPYRRSPGFRAGTSTAISPYNAGHSWRDSNMNLGYWNDDLMNSDDEFEDEDMAIPSLRFSTSAPDVLLMPIMSCFQGQMCSVKRPDYYYEQILESSRSAKASRWANSQNKHRNRDSIINSTSAGDDFVRRQHARRIRSMKSPRTLSSARRSTVSSIISQPTSMNRASSTQRQDGSTPLQVTPESTERVVAPTMSISNTCILQGSNSDINSSWNIQWHDWVDHIRSPPQTPSILRATHMWQKILRNWRYTHRGRSNLTRHCRDTSASYFGSSNLQKLSASGSAAYNYGGLGGATDFDTISPSMSNATTVFNPYLVEPTYLQRGVSESGRHETPNSALAAIYSMANHGQIDNTSYSNVASSNVAANSTTATVIPSSMAWNPTASNATGAHDQQSVAIPFMSGQKSPAVQRSFGDGSLAMPSAPHRRLSIIKSQELGTQRALSSSSTSSSHGSSSSADSSLLSSTTDERSDSTSSTVSQILSGTAEKGPILIAQLDDPKEAVEMLSSFYARLRLRLEKAKAESEDELLRIIQDLEGFVEEGLSYVNEDMDFSEPEHTYEDTFDGHVYPNNEAYVAGDDYDGTCTPGLVITKKSLSDELARTKQLHTDVTKSSSYQPPQETTQRANSRLSTKLELKTLNQRLQDMLNLHGDHAVDSHNEKYSYPEHALFTEKESNGSVSKSFGKAKPTSPPQRILRSPSIRRFAFFKSLASEANASTAYSRRSTSSATNRAEETASVDPHPKGRLNQPVYTLHNSPSDPILRQTSEHMAETPNSITDSLTNEQEPSKSSFGIRHSISQPARESNLLTEPEPLPHRIQSKKSLRSIGSTNSSGRLAFEASSHSGSRHSFTERSQSRGSMYSTESVASLVASPLVEEDQFKPTPFLEAIMELVNIIGSVISLSAENMLHPISGRLLEEALEQSAASDASHFDMEEKEEERHRILSLMPTEYLVQQLNALGYMWERPLSFGDPETEEVQHPWPCRGLFFRALLAISSLNRIVMWYVAVRSTYSEDIIEELDRRTFIDQVPEPAQDTSGLATDTNTFDHNSDDNFSSGPRRSLLSSSAQALPVTFDKSAAPFQTGHRDSTQSNSTAGISVASNTNLWHAQPASDITESASNNILELHNYQADHPLRWQGQGEDSMLDTTAVDKGLNMLLEVALDGRIRYISPTCRQLLGADPESMIDLPATAIFDPDDAQVCRSAVEQLLADSTRTVEINVKVHAPGSSSPVDVEAKGMLIYNKSKNEPSHVLWVLRYVPVTVLPQSTQPDADKSTSDDGVEEADNKNLSQYRLSGTSPAIEGRLPLESALEPITCRICDRGVPAAHFEEHTWLCAKSHRAAMDVCRQNDRLSDVKAELYAWYPGCSVADLESLVHGVINGETLREQAQLKASEVGNPAWQSLLDEANPAIKSMSNICSQAMALDETDAAPKCELPKAEDAQNTGPAHSEPANGSDFVRSPRWMEVAKYQPPLLKYKDHSLEAIGSMLTETITAKLRAIDDLQYAVVDSSVAWSNWMPIESGLTNQGMFKQPDYSSEASISSSSANSNADSELANIPATVSGSSLEHNGERGKSKQSEPELSRVCSDISTKNSDMASAHSDQYSGHGSDSIAVLPLLPKTLAESVSSSQTNHLSVTTKDLRLTPSRRSQHRSSISNSAALAMPTMPSINDFVLLKPISKGAYGSVFLAKKRATGEYYAIKILKKADMIAKNQISNVKAERAIMMAQTGSPFVVRLLYTFQSRTNLYLVMEYLNGGDCASLLKAIGTLPENWAQQYLAEVVLGVEDLHARNVVHRDLKPDNLLIDSEGHLKLTDFGLSKLGFLGRRVDQQAVNNVLDSEHKMSNQPCTSATEHGLIDGSSLLSPNSGTSSNKIRPLLSATPYSVYYQESKSSNSNSSMLLSQKGESANQATALVPSVATPPPARSDNPAFANTNETVSKRVAALKPSQASPSVFGLSGISEVTSSSSSASLQSDEFSQSVPPHQHKHALGTPDYIAPESILGLEAGESVDWWALGIICYEFIFGIPPFHDETPEKVFRNILSADIDFYDDLREQIAQEKRQRQETKTKNANKQSKSDSEEEDDDEDDDTDVPDISPEARDFITRLLCRDPKRRLGYNGAEEVKAHPMFKSIDWATILETQAAFVPQVENIEDTDYFDSRGATMGDHEVLNEIPSSSKHQEPLEGEERPSTPMDIANTSSTSISKSKADANIRTTISKSHEQQSEIPLVIARGVPINRSRTLPTGIAREQWNSARSSSSESSEDSGNGGESQRMISKQSTLQEDENAAIRHQHQPPLDDAPDPEFGGFTFKNLHALEQANLNELIKLRRRSTMLDISAAPISRADTRASFAYGSSSPNSPSSLPKSKQHYSQLSSGFSGGSSSSGSMQQEHVPPGHIRRTSTFALRDNQQGTPPESPRNFHQQHYSLDQHIASANQPNGKQFAGNRPSFTDVSSGLLSRSTSSSGHLQAQYMHGQRGSLLNPTIQSSLAFGQHSPMALRHSQIYRPVTTNELDSALSNVPPIESGEPAYMHSKVCLVADDNPVRCRIMEIMLQRLHFGCVIVRNGAEALRCAMGRTVFRAIFMDTGMPIVDGEEATRMIKSTYNVNKDTPIISMTTYDGETSESLYDGSIVKPVSLHHVKQSLAHTSWSA